MVVTAAGLAVFTPVILRRPPDGAMNPHPEVHTGWYSVGSVAGPET